MPCLEVALPALVVDVLVQADLCKSKGEARRQIQQGSIKLGSDRSQGVSSHEQKITHEDLVDGALVVWRGKKKSVRITQG